MGGGLMQLVAYGAQDIYLTGNPQITFFKVVYRRHTNFAMEAVQQTVNGTVALGNKVSCKIARNGDLLGRVWLELSGFTAGAGDWETVKVGHAAINFVELEVGGQLIDKQYGEWMEIWSQLTHDSASRTKLLNLVKGTASGSTIFVPLQFWFCTNPGLALPLIALQYHEVKLSIQFNTTGTVGDGNAAMTGCSVWCDYIYLDTDERRRFAQVSHEYLIEQVQYNGSESLSAGTTTKNVELRFNHPVKELVWTVQNSGAGGLYSYGNSGNVDQISKAKLQLNGHDRMREREGTYFRLVQPYQHHTGGQNHSNATGTFAAIGGTGVLATEFSGGIFEGGAASGAMAAADEGYMYCYSFALKPEEHQPSGTCNFSRIDNAILNLTLSAQAGVARTAKVYAVNYNVLRVMSGMGGLAYSN
jgi:hypothetical protein